MDSMLGLRIVFGLMLLCSFPATFSMKVVTPRTPPELLGSKKAIQIRVRSYTNMLTIPVLGAFFLIAAFV